MNVTRRFFHNLSKAGFWSSLARTVLPWAISGILALYDPRGWYIISYGYVAIASAMVLYYAFRMWWLERQLKALDQQIARAREESIPAQVFTEYRDAIEQKRRSK